MGPAVTSPAKIGVLFIHSSEEFGADAAVHADLMRHLDRDKYEVHVACTTGSGPEEPLPLRIMRDIPGLRVRPTSFVPRLFSFIALGVGVLGSGITLAVRRWGLAWVCALGLFAGSVTGVLSIWTQQTTTSNKTIGPGPGIGLTIAVIAVIVLLVKWVRIAASRPPQL